jgi:hypothetical protein
MAQNSTSVDDNSNIYPDRPPAVLKREIHAGFDMDHKYIARGL